MVSRMATDPACVCLGCSLQSVFPGLTAAHTAGTTYAARCWTHLTNQFTNGVVSVGPTTAPGTAAFLGGRKVYGSGTGGVGSTQAPTGANTRLGSYYQHFAAEWYDVAAGVTLTVTDRGTVINVSAANPWENVECRHWCNYCAHYSNCQSKCVLRLSIYCKFIVNGTTFDYGLPSLPG